MAIKTKQMGRSLVVNFLLHCMCDFSLRCHENNRTKTGELHLSQVSLEMVCSLMPCYLLSPQLRCGCSHSASTCTWIVHVFWFQHFLLLETSVLRSAV